VQGFLLFNVLFDNLDLKAQVCEGREGVLNLSPLSARVPPHPIEGRILSGSFSQDAQGHWYVNLAYEVSKLDHI
jgi:hypothetical protein